MTLAGTDRNPSRRQTWPDTPDVTGRGPNDSTSATTREGIKGEESVNKSFVIRAACGTLAAMALVLGTAGKPLSAYPAQVGVNLPWVAYGHTFGTDGLHGWTASYNGSTMQTYFNDMKAHKCNICRIWVGEDFQGMTFSGNNVTGVNSQYLANIKDCVSRANGDGICAYITLLNNVDCIDYPYVVEGNQSAMINNAIVPIAKEVSGYWVQFDIVNEVDYLASKIGWPTTRTFLANATKAIHNVSGAWVTSSTYTQADYTQNFNSTVGGLGFNCYDIHCYSNSYNPNAPVTPALVGNAPLFCGEFGPLQGTNWSSSIMDNILGPGSSSGWHGFIAWDYLGGGSYGLQGTSSFNTLEYYGNLWGA
jgi:hypothetical protein